MAIEWVADPEFSEKADVHIAAGHSYNFEQFMGYETFVCDTCGITIGKDDTE